MILTSRRSLGNDLFARIAVGTLFALLSINLTSDFLQTHRVTGLLLLVSEALVAVLTIVRRPAGIVDRSVGATVVTMISLIGPALLRTSSGPGVFPDLLTALVSCAGLMFVIAGKIAL